MSMSLLPTPDLLLVAAMAVALVALILCIIFALLFLTEKGRAERRLEDAANAWRAEQMEVLRIEQMSLAQEEAREQLEAWKRLELEATKQDQVEIARREARIEFDHWKAAFTKETRVEAIQKSQAVVAGKVAEHFMPYLPEFPYNPKDARFLGTPIDFVVFDGLDQGEVRKVVFVEVKTGAANLNERERQVREAVEAGRIAWIEVRHYLSGMLDRSEIEELRAASQEHDASASPPSTVGAANVRVRSLLQK